jgi:hypothetical protein
VQNVGGVDVLETAKDLVDERLEMRIGQGLAGADNGREITFHQFCGMSDNAHKYQTVMVAYPRRDMFR